jgi:hypothetical protein
MATKLVTELYGGGGRHFTHNKAGHRVIWKDRSLSYMGGSALSYMGGSALSYMGGSALSYMEGSVTELYGRVGTELWKGRHFTHMWKTLP